MAKYLFNPAIRREEIRFDLILKKQILTRDQKKILKCLPAWLMADGEDKFHCSLKADYLGGIEKDLEYLERLLDNGFILGAVSKELIHAKCLIQNIFAKIERIEKKYVEVKHGDTR
ncbi:MAG: hypothetical protein MUP81_05480 [Dehalococcoidia bacterium]|nr:hypothetical protein [Dehalococcoidia bacterium]